MNVHQSLGETQGHQSGFVQNPTQPPESDPERWAKVAFNEIISELSTTTTNKNVAANRLSFKGGQLVGAGLLDCSEAESRLMNAARSIGLPELEARATIKSGLNRGCQNPRFPEDRPGPVTGRQPRQNSTPGRPTPAPPPAEDPEAVERSAELTRLILEASTDALGNPYLERKRVDPVETLRQIDLGALRSILGENHGYTYYLQQGLILLVPAWIGGRLSSFEMIDVTGKKFWLKGGPKRGAYWRSALFPHGDGTGVTFHIGEGASTVLTATGAMGGIGVAGFSNNNLGRVSVYIRGRFPKAKIFVLADLDANGHPDRYAIQAAKSVHGWLVKPRFEEASHERKTE
ncbi:MAG: hypothetical protein HQL93_13155 [Magnetococcales bacterium]|nr:hypothetical protein [Magnetococcales bacterium]